MKEMDKQKCETHAVIQKGSKVMRSERKKMMKAQKVATSGTSISICQPSIIYGDGVAVVETDCWKKLGTVDVQTANGPILVIRLRNTLSQLLKVIFNFLLTQTTNPQTNKFLRSEKTGSWLSHASYIKENLEKEKMRFYDIR